MRVLVTGGTGFIGTALLPALQAAGHAVTVLSRAPDAARVPHGVAVIGDLAGTGMAAPEAVINLAGENLGAGRWNAARKQAFIDSRVSTTEALIAAFDRWAQPPRVLVNGSAIGWYGARGDETLTVGAGSLRQPGHPHGACAWPLCASASCWACRVVLWGRCCRRFALASAARSVMGDSG